MRSHLDDPIMQAGPRAFLRAAERAKRIAFETNTPLVFTRNGVVVKEMVTEADLETDD